MDNNTDNIQPITVGGNSDGFAGQKAAAINLLQDFISKQNWSLDNAAHRKEIATTTAMELWAGYLHAATYGNDKRYYGHTTVEVYFNIGVKEVETKCMNNGKRFSDIWQKNVVSKLIKDQVQRVIKEGIIGTNFSSHV